MNLLRSGVHLWTGQLCVTVGTTPGAERAELGERAGAMGRLTGHRVSGTEDPTVGTFLKYCLESHVSGKWKGNDLGHFQKMVANDSFLPSVLLGYTWHFCTRVAGVTPFHR